MACPTECRDRNGTPKRPASRARQHDKGQRVIDPEQRMDDGNRGSGAEQNGRRDLKRLDHRSTEDPAARRTSAPHECG